VATGLAWTEVGGEILATEVGLMRGKGGLTLTGHLGDVMQESARAALSYVRSRSTRLSVAAEFFEQHDIHVHVPEGAIPKDGPSAGITMGSALLSATTRVPVRQDVAMTGEITLRGKVLPVGGIKDKVLAAFRAGIREVILPVENEKDLEDIPEDVRSVMTFHLVKEMDEVVRIAFDGALPEVTEPTAESAEARSGNRIAH
jgi:ATP-dependent Lon protease